MHIKSLTIENFRGISHISVENMKQINLIVGKNNASKTTILEALFLLIGAGNPELILRIDSFRSLVHNESEDFRYIFYNLNYDMPIQLKGKFNEGEIERELIIKPVKKSKSVFTTKRIPENVYSDPSYENTLQQSKIDELHLEISLKTKGKPKRQFSSSIVYDNGFTINLPEKYKETIRGIYMYPPAAAAGGDRRLENLIVNKRQQKLIEALKQIEPSITDISLGTNKMIYFDIGLDRLVPVNLFGDGTKRLLYILLSISDAKDGILMIDEIDNGLHFSALKHLWDAIIIAAKEYNVQLFATTHNYETLKYLKESLEQEQLKDFQNKVTNYTIRKLPQSRTKAYAYDFESFEMAIEEGIELR